MRIMPGRGPIGRGRRVVAMIVLVVCAAGTGAAASPPGAEELYTSTEGNYRVLLPGKPALQRRAVTSKAGTQTMNIALCTTPEGRNFGVIHVDYPEPLIRVAPVDDLFRGGIEGMRKSSGWTILSQEPIAMGDHPGREIRFESRAPNGEKGVGRARIYLVGNRLYQLLLVGPESKIEPGEFDRVLGSFALLHDVPRIAPAADGAAPSARPVATPRRTADAGPAMPKRAADAGVSPSPSPSRSTAPIGDESGFDPGKPAEVPVDVKYDPARLTDVPPSPRGDREAFREPAPAGGVLVGVRVGYISIAGARKLGGVQPVFQAGSRYALGKGQGSKIVRGTTVVAKPGYAVGGINLHAGSAVDALQVVFMKVRGDKLDPNDAYTSEWHGAARGTRPSEYSGRGRPVVGLRGRSNGRELSALGLILAD